jgi:aminoglycoside N3'-acetyltransferase
LRTAVGPEGTIVMPSWSSDDDAPYDRATTLAAADLGVTAELLRHLRDARRTTHPLAFAAVGARAADIVGHPDPLPVMHEGTPVARVHALDGKVLLLGVGHDANTTIHLAESRSRVPYSAPRHFTRMVNGVAVRTDYTETDHCCQRFALADDWLRPRGMQREGPVGHGHARLVRSRDVVAVVCEQLQHDPLVFLHEPLAGCGECDLARSSLSS